MKVRIVSDGQGINSRVENAETGEVLEMVKSVEWKCDPSSGVHLAVAVITLIGVPMDVVVDTEIKVVENPDFSQSSTALKSLSEAKNRRAEGQRQ